MDTKIPYGSAAADRIADLQIALEQARDAQETAETAQRRAEERAQRETDRADGAEIKVYKLLAEKITHAAEDAGIDPYRISLHAIADSLSEDMDRGVTVEDLTVEQYVRDWEADR